MILSLYLMVISFLAYIKLPEYGFENASIVALWIGITCFWIAEFRYSKLKDEIKDLKKEIDRIKE